MTAQNDECRDENHQAPSYRTEKEVARHLGLSVKWLQKMRLIGGGIPYHKFGSAVRYASADVRAFETESRRSSTSDGSMYTRYSTNNGGGERLERSPTVRTGDFS